MSEGAETEAGERDAPTDVGMSSEELAAEVELLTEENRRLRAEVRRARQRRYRQTALGLAALGAAALAGAALFPLLREVLLALSGTGLFAAVLLYALTPERFIAASVGERLFETHAATGDALVADLGLSDSRVYLPGGAEARLFVPQREGSPAPDPEELDGLFVVDADHRGVALPASGAGLYREFERDLVGDVAADPGPLADQLADALVDGFEVVEAARPDAAENRVTVAVEGNAYGEPTAFDHPVPSFLAVGVAEALDVTATVEVSSGDERADSLVTVRWPADGEAGPAATAE